VGNSYDTVNSPSAAVGSSVAAVQGVHHGEAHSLAQYGTGTATAVPPSHVGRSGSPKNNDLRSEQQRDPVIGHMGFLVPNGQQVAIFGGSSTGVHFLNQADQQLQTVFHQPEPFPNAIYRLYLHNTWMVGPRVPLPSLRQSIVSQLPDGCEHIIGQAIDCWTPIYPIVHKQSTLESLQAILQDPSNADICSLYQILLLIALGMFEAAATEDSRTLGFPNAIAAPEVFYDISQKLVDIVCETTGLAALQGLQLAQIYLQMSARHGLASHLGGTATRMAQSLGLHRHSHRFRFDILETELRRRVWWCQYAIDT
jgi:hypothetical protein